MFWCSDVEIQDWESVGRWSLWDCLQSSQYQDQLGGGDQEDEAEVQFMGLMSWVEVDQIIKEIRPSEYC